MKKFISRLIVYLITVSLLLVLFYNILSVVYNINKNTADVYVFGDSQIHQGIDLNTLSRITGKRILTASQHGQGVYDFLVFAEVVPEKSMVILSLSQLMQVRRKDKDRNESGIYPKALWVLYKNGYTTSEIFDIIKLNKRPSGLFNTETRMYEFSDTINQHKFPVQGFVNLYSEKPPYLESKQNILIVGIEELINKSCKIILIDFPFHENLAMLTKTSKVQSLLEGFKVKVDSVFVTSKTDTLIMNVEKPIFYDLTHFNEYGAKQVSVYLGNLMNKWGGEELNESSIARIYVH